MSLNQIGYANKSNLKVNPSRTQKANFFFINGTQFKKLSLYILTIVNKLNEIIKQMEKKC